MFKKALQIFMLFLLVTTTGWAQEKKPARAGLQGELGYQYWAESSLYGLSLAGHFNVIPRDSDLRLTLRILTGLHLGPVSPKAVNTLSTASGPVEVQTAGFSQQIPLELRAMLGLRGFYLEFGGGLRWVVTRTKLTMQSGGSSASFTTQIERTTANAYLSSYMGLAYQPVAGGFNFRLGGQWGSDLWETSRKVDGFYLGLGYLFPLQR